jgi:hypothetical protein
VTARSAQLLVAALSLLLFVLVGATLFVVLTRAPVQPTPSPSLLPPSPAGTIPAISTPSVPVETATVVPVSPSPVAPSAAPSATFAPSPSPFPTTASATGTPTASPSPTPSPTPTPTPSPTPSPTPTPTLTPVPTIVPTAPQREIRVASVGLDNKSLAGSVPRILTFEVDGQSMIHAEVSGATAQVRLCVWREAVNDEQVCTSEKSFIDKAVTDTGSSLWHVSVIGTKSAPSAAIRVVFNANAPSVQFDNFRFYGTSNPAYNGFTASVDAGAGPMPVTGAFDDGQVQRGSYDFHLVIANGGGTTVFEQSGSGTSFVAQDDQEQPPMVDAGTYSITLANPDELANPGLAVFVSATITWP